MKKKFHNQKGQIIVEYILLLTALLGLFFFFTKTAKEEEWLESIIRKPWVVISALIETGNWQETEEARANHPNHHKRHASWNP